MKIVASLVLLMTALVLSACGPAQASCPSGTKTVRVTMTDALRFEPDELSFAAGETVCFELVNTGAVVHEFLIGDDAQQAEYAEQMAGGHGGHDENAGVSVEAGKAALFTYTFSAAGELLAGCHEPGHYEGGMIARISVAAPAVPTTAPQPSPGRTAGPTPTDEHADEGH